ncbi:MAG: undecaprenyldiphospho-muramoylpentapeptide beta-N-acetylglucosaminyltransferase [Alphaproteobacteria bacterium]|nr:undecaprenyldiphospho-muramoylpentapeptide beta-N-acetylglucosaminyltransferase [Alphaproteobacteria bacterium]
MKRATFVLAAGGTGGHLFPAQALAEELVRRGHLIHLMTDERVRDYGKSFPAVATHIVPSATVTIGAPHRLPGQLFRLWRGYRRARAVLRDLKPDAVIGFGGYPSFPPILAAARLGIACCVHDQNAVMGRANRVLARCATRIASSFPNPAGLPPGSEGKLRFTGNPVRDIALRERAAPYPSMRDGGFNLLVFGGSQGARFFGEFTPKVMAALPAEIRRGIRLVQQVRPEDQVAVGAAYESLGVKVETAAFFSDMPKRIANSHLVICRSGASTIAELGVIGRPAILVPLPHAVENDQLHNAEHFASGGAGWVRNQADLDPADLAAFLTRLRSEEGVLTKAAAAALAQGRPDAAAKLADLAEELAGKDHP